MTDNFNSIVALISGSSIIATLFIASIKKLIKSSLVIKYGDLGVQLTLFVISLILATFIFGWQFVPEKIVVVALTILSGANMIYQVLWKAVIQKAILGRLDLNDK